MGNENQKKGKKGPPVHIPTPSEIKTYIMIAQNKLTLFRNKKIDAIRKKKLEIAKSLKENNLDVAKAKMDSLIREEDYITSYDILGPLLEILKERVTYIVTSTECPPDLRAQLDTVIYASTRLEGEELYKLRDLIMRKYGMAYITKAESNADKLVNINLVEKLKIKPASDAFLTIRLKQLCKEKNIPFEFPCEINSDLPGDIGNPFDQQGVNPYGGGNEFNPYGPPQGGNNPYGPPPGNNPYGPPNNNFNPYGGNNNNNPYGGNNNNNPYGGNNNNNPYGGNNNNNPYGGNNNNNPYGGNNNNNPYGGNNNNNAFGGNNNNNPYGGNNNNNPFGGNNNNNPYGGNNNNNPFGGNDNSNPYDNNPYGPPSGNNKNDNNNPYGPPSGNNKNDNNNPYGPPSNDNNPYGPPSGNNKTDNNNPYGPPSGNNNNDPFSGLGNNNPYGSQNDKKDNNFGGDFNDYMNKQNNQNNDSNPFADNTMDNSKIDNKSIQDPFAGHTTESIINPQKLDLNKQMDNNNDNPFASQVKGETDNSTLNDPFKQLDNDPFGKGTVASFNENQQPPMKNQYSMDEEKKNSYGASDNNNNDNPFASMNNSGNPYSGGDNPFAGQDFPKADANDNPFADIPKSDNPYEGDKSVSDQMFVNPKVESYNDVDNNHLTTLASQIRSDKDKPSQ